MADGPWIQVGHILRGPLFSEPMRVETLRALGPDSWVAGLVGLQSERFRNVTLTATDLERLSLAELIASYDGDGASVLRNPIIFESENKR
jgi:hypothetical protein